MMGRKYRSRRETDMSIVVNIYYTGSGGNARKFAEEMEAGGTAGEIRREEGNLRYDLHMRVERYVSDEVGMPEADRRFVKE